MNIQPKTTLTRTRILQIVFGIVMMLVGLTQMAHGVGILTGR